MIFTGDFDLNGLMPIGPVVHKTNIRFSNLDHFERYINAIVVDYDSKDVTFTEYVKNYIRLYSKLVNEVLTLKVLTT